ncbi:MAG: zinc ribbon domain-containing protein [Promethearchaeota archaeon]
MSNDFIPLSAPLGIPGSSYMVQLGKVGNTWAIRLAKGNDVLDSKVFHNNTGDDPPNANNLVAWIISALPIPNLNPYQIAKSVGFIRQESIRRHAEMKRRPAVPMKDVKEAELTKAPIEKKPSKSLGWVKEDNAVVQKKAAHRILPSIPGSGSGGPSGPSKGTACQSCGTEIRFCPYCGKPL